MGLDSSFLAEGKEKYEKEMTQGMVTSGRGKEALLISLFNLLVKETTPELV